MKKLLSVSWIDSKAMTIADGFAHHEAKMKAHVRTEAEGTVINFIDVAAADISSA